MAELTKDMYWLAQDIYCRYVVKENLSPPGDIRQVAQTCIALTNEFFVAFQATQEALQGLERKDLEKAFGLVATTPIAEETKGNGKPEPLPTGKPEPTPTPATTPTPIAKRKRKVIRKRTYAKN